MEFIEYRLPWPPSINHYWRHKIIPGGKREVIGPTGKLVKPTRAHAGIYVSSEGKAFRRAVIAAVMHSLPEEQIDWPVSARILLWSPNGIKRDIDNRVKPILDAMTLAGVWTDDWCVRGLAVLDMGIERPNGLCIVQISDYERPTFRGELF